MFRLPAYFRPPLRRAIAALSLVGFLAVNIGFPVVEPSGKDLSQPFPCMDKQCGCRSATACWQGCCCHTNREKLAWAEEHGVTPPAYVFAAAAKEEPIAVASCCTAKKSPAKKTAAAAKWRVSLVPTIAARKCQGLAQLWVILSAAVPPVSPVEMAVEVAIADLAPLPAENLLSYDLVPPTPPPRA